VSLRVYIPTTSTGLAAVVAAGRLDGPFRAHAVTSGLQAEWPDADEEQWEYAAMYAAADSSFRRIGAGDQPRRFVIAADVPLLNELGGDDSTEVAVTADVPWKRIASVHADPVDVDAATVEEAELAWFATQEISGLLSRD
jgi:hypothetical protein